MGAKLGWVEPNTGHPLLHETGILPGGQAARSDPTSGEQELTRFAARQPQVLIDRHSCLVGKTRTGPADRSYSAESSRDPSRTARRHVVDTDGDHVAAAKLAIDRQVEQREVTLRPSICSLVRIDQTWLGRKGGLAPTSLPLFHGEGAWLAAEPQLTALAIVVD
jgi:hypothetical protein